MNLRLFIAIDLPDPQRRRIADLPLPAVDARPANPAQLHITLRFLGDTREEEVPDLVTRLEHVRHAPFPLTPFGVGAFPSPHAPRVLWVGIAPHAPMISLRDAIDANLGIPRESQPFHPHLTLARLGPRAARDTRTFLSAQAGFDAGTFVVDGFHLYRSTLGSRGATHTKIATFFLAPPVFPS